MEAWLLRVAPCDLPVLIHGESGSGKERIAHRIHRASPRREGPFVALNCTALPEPLMEAELFGARRGAFTGSDRNRPGLFGAADGGTLFLDEVGDMPAALQAKLLRVLQEGSYRPLGATGEERVDVRILAASHRRLAEEVASARFRADLFYRLSVLSLDVPPLRARREDLAALVESLAPRVERETGHGPLRLSRSAWRALSLHTWPGNIRELHSVLARGLLRAGGGPVGRRHLEFHVAPPGPEADSSLERAMIVGTLAATGGNLALASRKIGWSRQKLYRRMRRLRVPRYPFPGGSERTSSDSSTFQ